MVHVAGPVRKGSRQTVQRCIRCGKALIMENSRLSGDIGYGLGELVKDDGGTLDHGNPPPAVQLCQYRAREKRRIALD